MNIAEIRKYDVTNGPGVRATLFVSGCTHNCEACFNTKLHDFNYGTKWTSDTEQQFIDAASNKLVTGISILGGEPLQQDDAMLKLLIKLKGVGKPIWMWTGYTYEDVKDREELKYVDVLVDGKFIVAQRDLNLKYRGSSNQRVITL